jgi:hypothetical protein
MRKVSKILHRIMHMVTREYLMTMIAVKENLMVKGIKNYTNKA